MSHNYSHKCERNNIDLERKLWRQHYLKWTNNDRFITIISICYPVYFGKGAVFFLNISLVSMGILTYYQSNQTLYYENHDRFNDDLWLRCQMLLVRSSQYNRRQTRTNRYTLGRTQSQSVRKLTSLTGKLFVVTRKKFPLLVNWRSKFSGILIKTQHFSFTKMKLKISPAKCRSFCLDLNVLSPQEICYWSCQTIPYIKLRV